ncbi:MAG: hypothetical protein BSOLF_1527 [Candidatus Carbobacillus altaicus]|uniref:Uncharacterized protein n=1 Tax=Candidatus Carbonibacillus altaicus TaxID=2163959 RepID=A0A2R6XZ91_9BACL|nr:MAG: hypothetical protein BSOLF_1527 [Candidatus Carbobacillus altaicus]
MAVDGVEGCTYGHVYGYHATFLSISRGEGFLILDRLF